MNQNSNLENFIVHYKNVLSDEECKSILKSSTEWRHHPWYSTRLRDNVDEATDNIDPQVCFLDASNETSSILKIRDTINHYCELNDTNVREFTALRCNKYVEGKGMRKHFDHITSIFHHQENCGIPILSLIIGLNSDYEGGELTFWDTFKVKTQTGDIVVWPSCFLYPHQVLPVTKGTRYTAVTWAY